MNCSGLPGLIWNYAVDACLGCGAHGASEAVVEAAPEDHVWHDGDAAEAFVVQRGSGALRGAEHHGGRPHDVGSRRRVCDGLPGGDVDGGGEVRAAVHVGDGAESGVGVRAQTRLRHDREVRFRGRPILEVDHVQRIAEGGRDHPVQMVALCPNCHAMKERGANRRALQAVLRDVAAGAHRLWNSSPSWQVRLALRSRNNTLTQQEVAQVAEDASRFVRFACMRRSEWGCEGASGGGSRLS